MFFCNFFSPFVACKSCERSERVGGNAVLFLLTARQSINHKVIIIIIITIIIIIKKNKETKTA